MAGKKKPGRRAYLNDYIRTASGEYVYDGEYHILTASEEKRRAMPRVYIILSLSLLVLFFIAGMMPTTSGRTFYVILPYVFSALSIIFAIMDAFKVALSKGRLKKHEHDKHVHRLGACTVATAVLMGASAVSQAIYIIINRVSPAALPDMAFLCLCALACAVSIIFFRIHRTYRWVPEKRKD